MPKPIWCNFCNWKGTTRCTLGRLLIHVINIVKTSNYLGTNTPEAGAPVSSVATVISGIGGIRLQVSGSLNAGGADGAWCTWCIGAPPQLVPPTTHISPCVSALLPNPKQPARSRQTFQLCRCIFPFIWPSSIHLVPAALHWPNQCNPPTHMRGCCWCSDLSHLTANQKSNTR